MEVLEAACMELPSMDEEKLLLLCAVTSKNKKTTTTGSGISMMTMARLRDKACCQGGRILYA
jgi:hypothetical protein